MTKKISNILKLVIVAVSVIFIGVRLGTELLHSNISEVFQINTLGQWLILLVVVLLMPVNWGIESKKWQFIVSKIERLSFKNCCRAVATGVTVAIFTPNRIGEFGGRILVLNPKNRITGIFATLLGGYAQLLITLILGIIALPWFLVLYPGEIPAILHSSVLLFVIAIIVLMALFVYLTVGYWSQWVEGWIKDEKKIRFFSFLQAYKPVQLLFILVLSLFRFLIFSTQFYLLLRFFNISIGIIPAYLSICLVYFLMALIPVISLFEFSVRGSVAVLIIGIFSTNSIAIFATTLLLWIINLAIPSLFGAAFLYRYKL